MIETHIVVSTCYIMATDAQKLEEGKQTPTPAPALVYYDKDRYGWFIHVPSDKVEMSDLVARLFMNNFSEAFVNLVRYAHHAGCTLLVLDRDGNDDLDFLPTFDW